MLAWANIHGSFVLAPILLGYAWLDDLARGRPARTSFVVLVVGTAATLVNPFGAGVWAYAAGIGANPVISGQVSEWQRTTPFTVPGLLFYLSGAAALVLAIRGRAALRWPDWLFLAVLFAIGVWAVRGLAWWPFGAVFVVGGLPDALVSSVSDDQRPTRPSRLPAVVAAVLVVLVVVALPWWRPADPITGRTGILSYAPSGIAAELRSAGSRWHPGAGGPDLDLVPGVGRARCQLLPRLPLRAVPGGGLGGPSHDQCGRPCRGRGPRPLGRGSAGAPGRHATWV